MPTYHFSSIQDLESGGRMRTRYQPPYIALVCLLSILAGCDSNDPNEETPASLAPSLDAGTELTYRWTQVGLDTLAQEVATIDTQTYTVAIAAESETIGSFSNLLRLVARSTDGEEGPTTSWYQLTDQALRDVAYVGAGLVPDVMPKRSEAPPSVSVLPNALPHGVLSVVPAASDSIIVRSVPRIVYTRPLETGTSWVSVNESFLQVNREVVGQETIEVEAGTFDTAVIEATFAPLEGVTFTEHVRDLVMIKRVSELPNAFLAEIGIVRIRETVELIGVSQ